MPAQISSDIPRGEQARLHELESRLNSSLSSPKQVQKLLDYLQRAKVMCQSIWAKFDTNTMAVGSVGLFILGIVQCTYLTNIVTMELWQYFTCSSMIVILSLSLCYLELSTPSSIMIMVLTTSLLLLCCGKWTRLPFKISSLELFSAFVLVCQSLGSFSNSLVVEEEKVVYFLLTSLIATVCIYCNVQDVRLRFSNKSGQFSYSIMWNVLKQGRTKTAIALCLLLSMTRIFNACREEQVDCQPSHFLTPLYSLTSDEAPMKNIRFFFLCLPSLIGVWKIPLNVLRTRGNLNGFSPLVLISSYITPISAMMLQLHWAVTSSTSIPDHQQWLLVIFARAIYVLALLTFMICFLFPLTIHFSSRRKSPPKQLRLHDVTVPSLYKLMKERLNTTDDGDEYGLPLVFGLGSAISSNYLIFINMLTFLLMMLAGDGMSLSICAMFLTVLLTLDFYRYCHPTGKYTHSTNQTADYSSIPVSYFDFSWRISIVGYLESNE